MTNIPKYRNQDFFMVLSFARAHFAITVSSWEAPSPTPAIKKQDTHDQSHARPALVILSYLEIPVWELFWD